MCTIYTIPNFRPPKFFRQVISEKKSISRFFRGQREFFESYMYSKLRNGFLSALVVGTPFSWVACWESCCQRKCCQKVGIFEFFRSQFDILPCPLRSSSLTPVFYNEIRRIHLLSWFGKVVNEAGEFYAKNLITDNFSEGECYVVTPFWLTITGTASECLLGYWKTAYVAFSFSPKFFWFSYILLAVNFCGIKMKLQLKFRFLKVSSFRVPEDGASYDLSWGTD